ncbi:serine carboxypeptidase-like 2 isoform X3 [Castanea sativa]|uniref:serine carboxypeptidase-like 2 isoform X3 n=1 Tax=Castanea sativa TaxID=21020 RepID=UPI003F64D952
MARLGSIFSLYLLHMLVLLLLLLLQACPQIAFSGSIVKFLPGFQGPLPFELETGYVGVGESEEVQLFYYFVKSESNPKEDPLVLWLTGGPGCSAWSGLVFEIGPLNFKVEEYNGSLPKLVINPYSWTKVSSIIFVDSPVGTGFSYAKNWIAAQSDDFKQVDQLHQFLIRWLIDHPEFVANPIYIAGDSYSGIPVPILVQQISTGNEGGIEPLINLQGYLLGNPVTDQRSDGNSAIPYAHGLGLISNELYESLKRTCGGEFTSINSENAECMQYVQEFYESYGYLLSRYWANDDDVRKALHIRQGSIGQWQRCKFELYYTPNAAGSFVYHVNLSTKGYRSLIYSGDHDITVPFLGTQAWIRSLNYSIVDDWRSWKVQGQVAGYTRTYSNKMTFATVKGGGHTAPEYKPKECFTMFKRWTSHEPL